MAHALRQCLDDGKSQPCGLPGAHFVGGIEPLKHVGGVLGGEVVRPVGEGGYDVPSLPVQLDGQGVRAVAQGVGEQIGEDPGHRPAVRPHRRQVVGDVYLHLQPRFLDLLVGGGQLVGQRPGQIYFFPLQGQLSPLDAGQVVERGDEGLEGAGPPLDHLEVFPTLFQGQIVPFQKLQIAQDGGQRRAQIMGHVGDLPSKLLLLPAVVRLFGLAQLQQVVETDQQLLRPGTGARQSQPDGGLVGDLGPHPPSGLTEAPLQGMPPSRLNNDYQQQENDDGGFHKAHPSRQM